MEPVEYLGPFAIGPNSHPMRGIYTKNALEAGCRIPSGSVDFVLCDPLYKNYIHYRWLGQWAERILRRGGNLMCQVGSLFAFDCEEIIRNTTDLEPRPRLYETLAGGYTRVWVSRSLQCVKTYLWFAKLPEDEDRRSWVHETIRGGGRDKQWHDWGDSTQAAETWIGKMTRPGDIVVDPFTGGGMVPAACIRTGRRYVAFEILAPRAASARHRLGFAQPSMIHPSVQLELDAEPAAL